MAKRFLLVLLAFITISALWFFLLKKEIELKREKAEAITKGREFLRGRFERLLAASPVNALLIRKVVDKDGVLHKSYRVNVEESMSFVNFQVSGILRENGLEIFKAVDHNTDNYFLLSVGVKNKKLGELKFIFARGIISIIIDDFGYFFGRTVGDFIEFPYKLAFSIIPGRIYSKDVAKAAAAKGIEVLIHQPMEPLNYNGEERGTIILTAMNRREILARIGRSFEDIPWAVGMNNHMGSRATMDRRTMEIVLGELKRKGKYFVDSITFSKSLGYRIARKRGVWTGKRSVFLDNPGDGSTISSRLEQLKRIAEVRGYAIGIGHSRRRTLKVLKREIPRMVQEGFVLVFPSELVQ
ncbi:MAG: divergent polysaccharide deacetylase family protein [Fidelibacterota bacterium]